MRSTIINACLLTDGKKFDNASVTIDGGVIEKVDPLNRCGICDEVIDAKNLYLSSGMVDIHTHGNLDTDFNNQKDLDSLRNYYIENGTLTVIPTLMTAKLRVIDDLLTKLSSCVLSDDVFTKVHLEGPFLSVKNVGAQAVEDLAIVDDNALKTLSKHLDVIQRITFAPDVVGAEKLIDFCLSNNIVMSMGHDDSVDVQIDYPYSKGAKLITHLYCRTSFVRRLSNNVKYLGLTEYALSKDDISCELIADRRHIPDKLFDFVLKIKGYDNICLVSDSIRTIDNNVYIDDGVALINGTHTYAGSVTPIFKMVENIVKHNDVPIEKAIKMATSNPAVACNLKLVGSVKKGYRAKMILFDKDFNIVKRFL